MAKPPVVEQVQVNFRMPVDLRDRIRAASQEAGRSMNAEIIHALEERYPAPYDPMNDQLEELMAILAKHPNDDRFDFLRVGLEEMRSRRCPQMDFEQFGYEILSLLRAIVQLYDIAVEKQAKDKL